MGRACACCGKKASTGNTVSHANNKARRRFNANIQKVRTVEDGRTVRKYVCTRCIRSGLVVKPVAKVVEETK